MSKLGETKRQREGVNLLAQCFMATAMFGCDCGMNITNHNAPTDAVFVMQHVHRCIQRRAFHNRVMKPIIGIDPAKPGADKTGTRIITR